MSDNGLKVTVDHEKFSEKTNDEKLELIYQAVVSQQKVCASTVASFKEHFDDCDRQLNNSVTIPRRNRKIDIGIGAGTGTAGYVIIDKLIGLIKSYISGG